MTTPLSKLLAQSEWRSRGAPRPDAVSTDELRLSVPPDWMQGRSVFGGLQAAFALRAMRALVPEAPLRTLQVTFIAPVAGEMKARARILRQGKNATHVEVRLGDDETQTQALMVGVFGTARSSIVARTVVQPALEVDAAQVFEKPIGSPALGPAFSGHFGVRWLRGRPVFSGDRSFQHVLEIALDDDVPLSESHLLAIADFMPPIGLSHLSAPAAGSTLTWMLELLVDRMPQLPLRGFRVDAELIAARDGYTDQSVIIYAPDRTALALSHQSMLVFG
jgi:hypothetical protein